MVLCALSALGALAAYAGPFTPGNLVVVAVGDGTTAPSSAATQVRLMEYTTGGTFVQEILMPTSVSGSNRRVTQSGSATSEGVLNLSTGGSFLTLVGYDTNTGTTNVPATTSAAVNRVIARVDWNGVVDSSTALTDAYSAGNIRGAMTTDGSAFWTSGTSSSAVNGWGVRYVSALGGTTSTLLSDAPTNIRVISIQDGQLYFSAATSVAPGYYGVATVGSGIPTSYPQTCTPLPGMPSLAGPSSYDFWFASSTTLYICDDRAVASGGGIQRWDLVGGTWVLSYTLNTGLSVGCRSLAGTYGTDSTILYATTAWSGAAANSSIVAVEDTGAASVFSTIVSGISNVTFRGLKFAPMSSSQTVLPTSFTRLGGTDGGGNLASLYADDDDRLGSQCDELDPNPSLEVVTTSPVQSVNQLEFKLISKASRTDMSVRIRLYNYDTSSWAEFAAGPSTLNDSTDVVTITTDPNRFIEDGTREMKAQVIISPNAEVDGFDGWGGFYNQTIWILQ